MVADTNAFEVVPSLVTQSLLSVGHADAVAVALEVVGGGCIPPAFSGGLDDPEPVSSTGSYEDGHDSERVSPPERPPF